jgi:biopolymer transport protein ExbB
LQAFAALQNGRYWGSKTAGVTGGISEALISTVSGLVRGNLYTAICQHISGLYRRQLALIQEYGGKLELLELLYRRYYASHGRELPCSV